MSLNWREIDAVLAELNLEGARLRRVRQPDYRRVILEFSSKTDSTALALVLTPGLQRIHRVVNVPKALPKPPRFVALLKARLEGARLCLMTQLGTDRVVRFTFDRGGTSLYLDARLWGSGANLILFGDEGRIIDAFSRRPKRGEAPGLPWPPEDLGKGTPPRDFVLRDLPGTGSWNRRVESYYREKEEAEDSGRILKLWETALDRRESRLSSRLKALEEQETRLRDRDEDGHWGDIIMAHLHESPEDRDVLEAEDWSRPGTVVRISLNPSLSLKENAERYYARRRRTKKNLERLTEDRRVVNRLLGEIERDRAALAEGRVPDEPPPGNKNRDSVKTAGLPGLQIRQGAFLILVGRKAAESDALLRRHTRGNDLWLHTRDHPGGHVFIRPPKGKSVPLEILLDAATLALAYSKAKSSGAADLYYTHVKHLRRVGNGPKVLPTREKNLRVNLDRNRLARLKAAARL